MKKYFILILPFLFILSCGKNENSLSTYDMLIFHDGVDHRIVSQEDLNLFVENVINKQGAIINSSSYKTLLDKSNQEFEAIVGKYDLDDKTDEEIIIVLENNISRNVAATLSFSVGCTMKCNEGDFCSACGMTVEEACKRVICSCTKQVKPGSGCGVEISTY